MADLIGRNVLKDLHIYLIIHYYILGDTPKPQFSYFLRREERSKEASTLPQAPPYMEGMQPLLLSLFH